MAICAHPFFDCKMYKILLECFFDPLVATEAQGIDIFLYQSLHITCMYAMTGATFTVFERKMDKTAG
jgi:hypothetical protein